MAKKRGRPPKTAKRGRGRPRNAATRGRGRGRGRGRPRGRPRARTRSAAEASAVHITAPIATAPTQYTPGKPFVVPIAFDEGATPTFKPTKVKPHDAKFKLPPPRPNIKDFQAVVMALTRVYLPDRYLLKIYRDTLAYIAKRKLHPRSIFKIVPRDILHFFVIIYYMGYCKLPSKEDYWTEGDDILGDHPVCRAFGMTYKKFTFLWRNIYLMQPRAEVNEEDSEDEGELEYRPDASTAYTDHYTVVRSNAAEDA